jgi:hypothetical protein
MGLIFMLASFIELLAGIALLTIYDNSLGFLGLIAACLMLLLAPLVDILE